MLFSPCSLSKIAMSISANLPQTRPVRECARSKFALFINPYFRSTRCANHLCVEATCGKMSAPHRRRPSRSRTIPSFSHLLILSTSNRDRRTALCPSVSTSLRYTHIARREEPWSAPLPAFQTPPNLAHKAIYSRSCDRLWLRGFFDLTTRANKLLAQRNAVIAGHMPLFEDIHVAVAPT